MTLTQKQLQRDLETMTRRAETAERRLKGLVEAARDFRWRAPSPAQRHPYAYHVSAQQLDAAIAEAERRNEEGGK